MTAERRVEVTHSEEDVVDVVVEFLLGRINRESLDENGNFVLDYCLGLMTDNLPFANQVRIRKEKRKAELEKGKKNPLFTDRELEPARKHRTKRKKVKNRFIQPKLIPDSRTGSDITREDVFSPERDLEKLHKLFNLPSSLCPRNNPVDEENKYKIDDLRNEIGLPVARGNSPHVNDLVYGYLVERVVHRDELGIFGEELTRQGLRSEGLEEDIGAVGDFLGEVLDGGFSKWQMSKRYREFKESWEKRKTVPGSNK